VEPAAGLDRGADDDELRPVVAGDLGDVGPDLAVAGTDDAARHGEPVRVRDRRGPVEVGTKVGDLPVEAGVERQLLRHDEGSDEDDPRAAVGREPAGEVERVLRLGAAEQGDDDAVVSDRRRPPRCAMDAMPEGAKVRAPHRITW